MKNHRFFGFAIYPPTAVTFLNFFFKNAILNRISKLYAARVCSAHPWIVEFLIFFHIALGKITDFSKFCNLAAKFDRS